MPPKHLPLYKNIPTLEMSRDIFFYCNKSLTALTLIKHSAPGGVYLIVNSKVRTYPLRSIPLKLHFARPPT